MPKTIPLTGTSSGIGHAAALRFAREGWNVVATMRSLADAADLAVDSVICNACP
jgi:NAD(P)-dependent dehydrogenase (short-subunit alcohol dehydrogenase family)